MTSHSVKLLETFVPIPSRIASFFFAIIFLRLLGQPRFLSIYHQRSNERELETDHYSKSSTVVMCRLTLEHYSKAILTLNLLAPTTVGARINP